MPSKKKAAKKSAKPAPKKGDAKKSAKPAPKKGAAKKGAAKKGATKAASGGSYMPKGWHTVTVGCAIKRAAQAVGFYEALFGAKVRSRLDGPGGMLIHADLAVGDANFMLGEPMGDMPEQTMSCMIYTKDPDALFHQALASGCTKLEDMTDQFWGDRTGRVRDPFGNTWMIAKMLETVSQAEMARRAQKMMAGQPWR